MGMNLAAKNELLSHAETLNKALENSYLALSLVLVEVESTEAWKEAGRESFVEWYKIDLGREKSTVSRLLTVGRFLKEKYGGELPSGQPSYKKLAASISKNKDADPELIISEALTWTDDDYKQEAKETCPSHDLDLTRQSAPCKHCKQWIKC